MAPIPPSHHRGFQFRAEEIDDFLEVVETYLPISAQNWQTVADSHLENYRWEARTTKSLCRKFQEIASRTGPTGDPNCPPYVIKAKAINRQLVQMIDASSGGSEAGRSDDGLSNAYDSENKGAGEFANVINEMNNTDGNGNGNSGGEEVDEEEDADDAAGIGVQGLVWLRWDEEGHQRADEEQPGVADDGVVGAVAGVDPPDGVAPAAVVARPRGRGPGRSRNVPAGAAGVLALLLRRLVSLALLLRLVSLALLLWLVSFALILLPSVLLVPPRPSMSAPWRRLEDVRLPHQSTAEGRDMLTAMMTRAVCPRRTLWGC